MTLTEEIKIKSKIGGIKVPKVRALIPRLPPYMTVTRIMFKGEKNQTYLPENRGF